MTTTSSTAYSRDLGDELRRLRQRFTGLRGRGLAVQLGWDPSKVSNLEHGKIRASPVDLAQYLTACGKDVDFLDDFLRRYHNAFDPFFAQSADDHRTLTMAQASATKITAYDVLTVNSLLRTPAYEQALETTTGIAPSDVDRQAVLRRPSRPECTFFLHELALRTHPGSPQVMEDQYTWLHANSAVLRIIPADATTAVLHSPCTLFEFERTPPAVHVETSIAKVFVQDDSTVAKCRVLFELLDAIALDEHESRRRLTEHRGPTPLRALARTQ
ncbi:Helix-turn-helix domain-containing protein [Lentzea fradiae]|uniref:Helix-turn-helix domain-containing protein n=1 Tax=Lentzea fradiae TaxID=200378 RepID=A0A1G7V4J3_9PSEU|nr:helix-turn-helix transcriptional regulator [Lentzea fradiae]SDG54795.1 Helix-turn-helix domain-containing protein [Lentzea fradiae]